MNTIIRHIEVKNESVDNVKRNKTEIFGIQEYNT